MILFDALPSAPRFPRVIRKAEHYRASGRAGQKKLKSYAVAFVLVLSAALVLQFFFRRLFFFPLKISGDSMAPEIPAGGKRYFVHPKLTSVAVGDIVLVEAPQTRADFLCRVVAVDGDKVRIDEGRFSVNGKALRTLSYRLAIAEDPGFQMKEVEVRPNFFFCLNDNAQNTRDSRTAGIFERTRISGKVIKPVLFF